MLLLENPNSGSPMYPYSSGVSGSINPASVVAQAPEADGATVLLSNQSTASAGAATSPAMLYAAQQGYITSQKPSVGGYNGSSALSDIMSHSMMQQPNTQQPNTTNTNSYYCWPPPPSGGAPINPPPSSSTTASSRFPSHQRRGPAVGGYRISGQNPPTTDFTQHILRQTTGQPTKPISGAGYPGGSMKAPSSVGSSSVGCVGASSHWKERPHVGKYSLIRTIGKGNFAKVKLAQHVTTGMEVRRRFCLPQYLHNLRGNFCGPVACQYANIFVSFGQLRNCVVVNAVSVFYRIYSLWILSSANAFADQTVLVQAKLSCRVPCSFLQTAVDF